MSLFQAFSRCRPLSRPTPAYMETLSASFKELRIYHSDISKDNFLLDLNNKVWMIDFQHVGVFPEVFQTYGFFNHGLRFSFDVARKLGYEPSSIANQMVKAASMLQMTCGSGQLGKY